ncbi:MAG: hypothetical protein Q9220_007425 [cf. Caloplaca sp. 1 TL-2023]
MMSHTVQASNYLEIHSVTPKPSIGPNPFKSTQSRWKALTHRAPSAHSSFFYGVISTKIYCRPTCSARLARRANIVFYDTADQARLDGFRPCKRCKPDDATFFGDREEVVTRAIALLRTKRADSTTKRSLKSLAQEVGVTPSYLCRVFKKTMGVTVGAYMKEFERGSSGGKMESPTQSNVIDVETGLLTPARSARSLSVPLTNGMGSPVDDFIGNVEDGLDLDFDFDEWFWTTDFANDSLYG